MKVYVKMEEEERNNDTLVQLKNNLFENNYEGITECVNNSVGWGNLLIMALETNNDRAVNAFRKSPYCDDSVVFETALLNKCYNFAKKIYKEWEYELRVDHYDEVERLILRFNCPTMSIIRFIDVQRNYSEIVSFLTELLEGGGEEEAMV